MCRAKIEGGRRCAFHRYGRRINTLTATIQRKEQELAEVRAVKVKTAEVKRRIRDCEATLAKKREHLKEVEAEFETIAPHAAEPEVEKTLKALQVDISTTQEEIEDLKRELRTLHGQLSKAGSTLTREQLQRRERDLIALISKKRDELRALHDEADAAKKEAEELRAAATAAQPTPPVHIYTPRTKNEDGAQMKVSLTESEMRSVKATLGEHDDLTSYALRVSLTTDPTFSDRDALAYVETRMKREGVTGRRPTVAGEHREYPITIREEVKYRAVIRDINAELANAYGLDLNDYLRRRVLGLDLYGIERDRSDQSNRERVERIAHQERVDGIATAPNLAEARLNQYRQRLNQSIKNAETKHGSETVRYALYLNANHTPDAAAA